MDKEFLQQLARQLRKPEGEMGTKVGENMNVSNRFMNRYTIEQLDILPHDNILEIGMGNGHFVQDIVYAAPGVMYTGCDYSPLMVEEAHARTPSAVKEGRAQFILATADALPFPDRHFDKIFTINTIYFWQPEKELSEIFRVLKPGGLFLLTVRSHDSMKNIPVTAYDFNLYSRERLTNVLTAQGFRVEALVEKEEPDMEFNGTRVRMETWILCCRKIN